MDDEHYSYRIYRDKETAEQFDVDRFGGPIGEYLKEKQESYILKNLHPIKEHFFLDVGGGTGRISIPIAQQQGKAIVLDSSPEMLRVAATKLDRNNTKLFRIQGDAHCLPVKTRSVDGIIMIRVLMHVVSWKNVIQECCRATENVLIVDYARKNSFALIESVVRKIQAKFSGNVQAYNTYFQSELTNTIRDQGFEVSILDPGYFLPLRFYS